MVMRAAVLAVLATAAAVMGASVPAFRSAYISPEGEVAQFYSGADSAFIYNWGYQFPGRTHSESKAHDGTVQGNYAFVDANGEVQQVNYQAGGISSGFDVALSVPTGITYSAPGTPLVAAPEVAAGFPGAPVPLQTFYTSGADPAVGLDSGSQQAIEHASPTLLAAFRSGLVSPYNFPSPADIRLLVNNDLVDQAQGSVSRLAVLLDVDTVAARHTQQQPPSPAGFYDRSDVTDTRGILETTYLPDGTPAYIVRIPYTS